MSCLCIIAFNIYDLFPFNANGEALEMNSNLYQEGEYDVDIKAQKHEKNHEDKDQDLIQEHKVTHIGGRVEDLTS